MQRLRPVRTLGGIMHGRRIEIQDAKKTQYTLDSARVVDGKLLLLGLMTGKGTVSFTLVGTTARASNPIPRASDADSPRRAVTEQTQSLYAASERGTGCELIFLRMGDIQLGVALAHQDNARGEEINQAICRVRRVLDAGGDSKAALDSLNRLLSE